MHGIEAQQMRIGFDRSEVVDADDFDIRAAGLRDSPQHIAADAAKPVDCDPDCHSISPQKFENPVFFGQLGRCFWATSARGCSTKCIIIPNVPKALLRIHAL